MLLFRRFVHSVRTSNNKFGGWMKRPHRISVEGTYRLMGLAHEDVCFSFPRCCGRCGRFLGNRWWVFLRSRFRFDFHLRLCSLIFCLVLTHEVGVELDTRFVRHLVLKRLHSSYFVHANNCSDWEYCWLCWIFPVSGNRILASSVLLDVEQSKSKSKLRILSLQKEESGPFSFGFSREQQFQSRRRYCCIWSAASWWFRNTTLQYTYQTI